MHRSLRAELRELRKEAERRIEFGRSRQHDEVRAWLRSQADPVAMNEALYPHEADAEARRVQAQIFEREQELAREGVTEREPPPEFWPGEPERDRRAAWLISQDPTLQRLMDLSDLGERLRRVVTGEPPSPPVEAFVDQEPEREYEELGPIQVEDDGATLGALILRARWAAAELRADAVLVVRGPEGRLAGTNENHDQRARYDAVAVEWRP